MLTLPSPLVPLWKRAVGIAIGGAALALMLLPTAGLLRPRPPRYADAAIRCAQHHCDVDAVRVRTLLESRAGLAGGARFMPTFRCGTMSGLKLYAIPPASILARLGLRNGDHLLRVDGVPLSSPEAAIRLYRQVRRSGPVRVEIERAGRPVLLTYTIR